MERKMWIRASLLMMAMLEAMIMATLMPAPVRSQAIAPDAEWVAGELLFKLSASSFAVSDYRAGRAAPGRTGLAAVDLVLADLAAIDIRNAFQVTVNAAAKQAIGMDRILHLRYSGTEAPPQAAARLAALPDIEWAEPNGIVRGDFVPNDPTYPLQWGAHNRGQAIQADGDSVGTPDCDLDLNQAWDVGTGSFGVVVAILDTGIDAGHPEFSNRVQSGWDFVNNDSNPADDHGHGTACAGIAAAAGNNGQGVAGVAWGVRILPVKVLNSNNLGNTANLALGVEFAGDFGAEVVSMSLSMTPDSVLAVAVNYAHGVGSLLLASTGNGNTNESGFPAAYANVIGVGALSPCNERKTPTSCDGENFWGSNYGPDLDVLAPGVLIHTTDIRGAGGFSAGDYTSNFNGTSAACPFVAGVAALMFSVNNSLTNTAVRTLMLESCDDLGAPFWDPDTGWGRLNAYACLRWATGAKFVGANSDTEVGSYRSPYNTVIEGINSTPVGNWVVIKPGIYDETTPVIYTRVLSIDAIDGGVTVR
jgi:subtilisin family serine protease